MTIEEREQQLSDSYDEYKGVVILPSNYADPEATWPVFSSTSISFHKFARGLIPIEFETEPEQLLEQRSGEWYGPVLLITSAAIEASPLIVSIVCGVIANYVTEHFKGRNKPPIKIQIIYKKTKKTCVREFNYEGDADGVKTIQEALKEFSSSDR